MCQRGASALDKVLRAIPDAPVRVWVVWEPVIRTDIAPPTTPVLALVQDVRAAQFWDPAHLISASIRPESAERHPVWDWVAVFPPAVKWDDGFPKPSFAGGIVVNVADEVAAQLASLTRR